MLSSGFFFTVIMFLYFPVILFATVYFWKCRNKKINAKPACVFRVCNAVSKYVVGRPSGFIWGRFRIITTTLVLLALLITLTVSVIGLMPEAYALDNNIQTNFGKYGPLIRPTSAPMSFAAWAFAGFQVSGKFVFGVRFRLRCSRRWLSVSSISACQRFLIAPTPITKFWGPYGTLSGNFRTETFTYKTNVTKRSNVGTCQRAWRPDLRLDVYFPEAEPDRLAPIIFHTHGGGWTSGFKSLSLWSVGLVIYIHTYIHT